MKLVFSDNNAAAKVFQAPSGIQVLGCMSLQQFGGEQDDFCEGLDWALRGDLCENNFY